MAVAGAGSTASYPNLEEESEKASDFLNSFQYAGVFKYREQLQEIANRERKVLEISMDDIAEFDHDGVFASNVRSNTSRYIKMFEECADKQLPDGHSTHYFPDIFDNLYNQRAQEIQATEAANAAAAAANGVDADGADGAEGGVAGAAGGPKTASSSTKTDLPRALIRRFEVSVLPGPRDDVFKLREVRAQHIGRLLRVKGMVTRISDVKPLASVVAYTCDGCGSTLFNTVEGSQFMPVTECSSTRCTENKRTNAGKVFMQTRGTKFVKYQEIRVQELPDEVPVGRIPRCMTVHCRGEQTRRCGPGDVITVAGVFMTMKFSGFKAMRAGLQADTYLEATGIERHKLSYSELEVDEATERQVREVARDPDPYSRLATGIAPEIYGHEDVKKALLLQLVGGVTKVLPDGMKIRGDLNICLMGDPGTAKSQLLKYIASISPRGVYTTGKGSSGVGLTAAVVKDPVTGDMALEGGALVMADRGICCIDEFDKMDEADRTSIHEVMEQQTISIAKAGITTTLNARAAVLAAANPLYGRYNRRKSISENIDLPNSLLSRFDLLFLILDKVDSERDLALSRHVLQVHSGRGDTLAATSNVAAALGANGRLGGGSSVRPAPISTSVIKKYIATARQLEPSISPDVAPYIVEAYVALRSAPTDYRAGRKVHAASNSDQTTMTARQLLSILRLSQAIARLRLSDAVGNQDVDEAIRLTHSSKSSLMDEGNTGGSSATGVMGAGMGGEGGPRDDTWSSIYNIIRDFAAQRSSDSVAYTQVEEMVLRKGFTSMQLGDCLREYQNIAVLHVDDGNNYITIL